MDEDGTGGVGTFVTRVEFKEYKEHQNTRHDNIVELIKSDGKATRLAFFYIGGLISVLTFAHMYLSYIGVI